MNKKSYSESCDQNRQPILEILRQVFSNATRVLEIGSGTGQHAAFFPGYLTHLLWQPSDLAVNLESIEAWRTEAGLPNVQPGIELDVDQSPWPDIQVDAVFCANALHIMSWSSVENFFNGVGKLLQHDKDNVGLLCLYGPFNYHGEYTSESNARFDQWLKQRDPVSGIRHFEDICALASANGMTLQHDYAMPANNRSLVFQTQ